jgi:hypothetical protein
MSTQNAVAEIIVPVRSIKALEKAFIIDDATNTVTLAKDSKLTGPEMLTYLSSKVERMGSETIRLANTLRLAKMLPDVEDTVRNAKGEEVKKKFKAFDWVIAKLKANSATASTFTNIVYLIPALEVNEKNHLNVSPFATKNALGWLKEKGVIDDDGKFKAGKETDPVRAKLVAGIGASKLAEDIRKIREEEKKAEAARNAPSAPAGETPAPVDGQGTPVEKGGDTPAKLSLDLVIMAGRFEKLNVELGPDKVRPDVTGAIRDLAKLAGFDLVAIK